MASARPRGHGYAIAGCIALVLAVQGAPVLSDDHAKATSIIVDSLDACRAPLPRSEQWFRTLRGRGWSEPSDVELEALVPEVVWTSQAMYAIFDHFPEYAGDIEQDGVDRLLSGGDRIVLVHPDLPGVGLAMSLGQTSDSEDGLAAFCNFSGAPGSPLVAVAGDLVRTRSARSDDADGFGMRHVLRDDPGRQPIRVLLLDAEALSDFLGRPLTHVVGINTLAYTADTGPRL